MTEPSPAFTHRLAVRFSDCDLLGHVNNAVYFTYFEQARLAWWTHLSGRVGFPGGHTVIVHAACDYKAPAHVGDELDISVVLAAIGRSSVTLTYTIVDAASRELIALGKTVNVTVDADMKTTIPVPEATRRLLTAGSVAI
jgi:acyl-CoA thioester hydrolase